MPVKVTSDARPVGRAWSRQPGEKGAVSTQAGVGAALGVGAEVGVGGTGVLDAEGMGVGIDGSVAWTSGVGIGTDEAGR